MKPADNAVQSWLVDNHLMAIHLARLSMIQILLPPAKQILDLGGVNSPLHRMGYPHAFDRMVLVDLPPDERHAMYSEIVIDDELAHGQLVQHFCDMTNLGSFAHNSFDLVWSGQSIEHVPLEDAERMCREAYRVLKPGGYFCLDTPNGAVTRLHAASAGLEMIHPEHFKEYTVCELSEMLKTTGFNINKTYGIRHMPMTSRDQVFRDYSDFLMGMPITHDAESSYIQFHECQKMG